ncbi:MAG TPA: hypothetical protein VGS80_04925 [Ktedonobacterales bacterium]|nr:hypothetical protein [Ktedonobacterales bacterium]
MITTTARPPGACQSWDAFQDGTVNPANTEYAFQTGLAGDALIDVYRVTNNVTYLQTAEEAAATFLPLSTTKVDAKCANCRYFWYSADPNDFGRFVKNTNMLLGSMYARLAAITQDPTYLTPAEQVFNTEQYEVATHANFHYLGFDDPKYSPTGTRDAHIVAEIWGLHDMMISLAPLGFSGAANSLPLLAALETFFWQCGDTCSASPTTDYGVRAACELAPVDASSRQRCEQAISMYLAPGARWLPPYPTLGVLQYLTIFGYQI